MIRFLYTGHYDVGDEPPIRSVLPTTNATSQPQGLNLLIAGSEQSISLDTPEEAKPVTSDVPKTVYTHIHVNAIADYYNIACLLKQSRDKIYNHVVLNWDAKMYSNVLSEIFSTTGDRELIRMMGEAAGSHLLDLTNNEDFSNTDGIGDFIMGLMESCVEDKRLLTRRLDDATEKEHSTRLYKDHLLGSMKSAMTRLDACMDTLKSTTNCRQCDAAFTCYMEKRGLLESAVFTLHCSKCRTRH